MKTAIGIDTGGTCTDAVIFDFESRKVIAKSKTLTTGENLSIGISKALDMLPENAVREASLVSLSTTLATNACVENKGGRSGLMLFGMSDELLERLKVEETYGIKRCDVKCVDVNSAVDGSRIDEPDWEELFAETNEWLREKDYMAAAELYGPSTGAPCEKKFKAAVKEKYGLDCVCANELTDKVNFIQRGATSLLNAKLLPVIQNFIDISVKDIRSRGCNAPIMVVRSDGSLMSTDATNLKPVETILSGPAASILSGRYLAGSDSYIVVDMGGTTTDVSIVRKGLSDTVKDGISIGSWKTSVDGVFVDTFALGGDSTIRCIKGQLQISARRCIPLCTASSRFPQVKEQLKALLEYGRYSKYPLYEFLYLIAEPKQRYDDQETALIEVLKDGPLSLYELFARGVDLYSLNTSRLEEEGVVIRFGLTPTDFMHIRGDYVEFDRAASLMALKYIFNENKSSADLQFDDAAALKLCDEAYNIVEEKLYTNLVRIMLSQDYGKIYSDGPGEKIEFLIRKSWSRSASFGNAVNTSGGALGGTDAGIIPERSGVRFCGTDAEGTSSQADAGASLSCTNFSTNILLLGVGAPTHVFLPAVAKALGTSCILPENAEIGNAIGAVMAELVVTSKVEISQWTDSGIYYIVHDENGTTRYESVFEAEKHAIASAEACAIKEARLRGADGDLTVQIIKEAYKHGSSGSGSLVYGGVVTARIRFSLM